MSQPATVRITTTETTTSSAVVINIGYLSSIPGLLKITQLILGCVCVGIIAYHFNDRHISTQTELFFYLMCVAFLICTAILILSCLISWNTGDLISRTIFELIYHTIAGILILIASIILLVRVVESDYYRQISKQLLAASVIEIINGLLYFVSTYYARKSYKGL